MLRKVWNSLRQRPAAKEHDLTDYWRNRARQHGRHSVLNMAHGREQFHAVTDHQKQFLFPLLKSRLNGTEALALDFGCGPGRFTAGLAELIGGSAIGVDITPELLELAPRSPSASYQLIGAGALPFADGCFDVVWSCLVLGGIPDGQVEQSIAEIARVLRPGGLFFFVENTARQANASYWFFRDENVYVRMAGFCQPEVLGRYQDIGEKITIFAGRKAFAETPRELEAETARALHT